VSGWSPHYSYGETGSYGISGVHPSITEVQAGSYLLMDWSTPHGEVEEIVRIER
jgi:hypothetical protein